MYGKMYSYYIKFSSVTTAQRAAQLLRERSVLTKLGKNPGYVRGESCSYALFFPTPVAAAKAEQLLREYGIQTRGTGEVSAR